jgi:tetratricopeptide (TPR) repeat protein
MLKIVISIFLIFGFINADENIKKQKLKIIQELNSSLYSNDSEKIYSLYKKLADIYAKNCEYYKALEYYKLSLKIHRILKTPQNKEKLNIYKNIALCYKKIGNNFKTFKYIYKAVQLASITYGKNSKITKNLNTQIKEIHSRLIANSIY